MSFLDQIKKQPTLKKAETTSDKSGPKLAGYVDESAINSYRQEVIESNIEAWLEPLGEHTFETYMIPLSIEDAIAIKLNYHNDNGTEPDISDRMTAEEIASRLSNLQERVQQKIDEVLELVKKENKPNQAQDGVFIKMSSRSAKDSPLYSNKLKEYYLEYLKDEKEIDVNKKVQAMLFAATKLLKVSNAETAFQFFTKSERIAQDMEVALADREKFEINVVIRRWTDIDIDMEFRGFYCNGKLNALSQYNYIVYFDSLQGKENSIAEKIIEFFNNEIKLKLDGVGFKRYIIDFAITGPNYDKISIIELNPFLSSTDSGLFSWKEERDLLENGPFEFRITKQKNPNLKNLIGVEWREILENVKLPQE